MADLDLTYAFGLQPEAAIRYFADKAKDLQGTWDWHELWQDAHARAFTVAKAMKADILQDIHAEVQRGLTEGITLAEFKKSLTLKLKARGWWGEVVNEQTGEVAVVGPHRLRTIFDTNVQTAYQAGHYRQAMQVTASRPWWQYTAVNDKRTRPAHAALNGLAFRFDDPFWDSHYPPNGFRCRCSVRFLDDVPEANKRATTGGDPSATLATVEKPVGRTGTLAQATTVKTTDLAGRALAMAPDVGWSYNPGKAALWHQPPKTMKVVPGQKSWKDYGRPDLREVPGGLRTPSPALLPTGKNADEAAKILGRGLGLADDAQSAIVSAADGDQVMIHRERLHHPVEKRQEARERYGKFVLATLDDPYEIWLTQYEDGFRKQYIGVFDSKYDLQVVVREEKDGTILWNFMHAKDKKMNDHRTGKLLRGKE